MKKDFGAYKTIGEVAQLLDLIDKKKGTLSTHTIRYWEKEFRQIKPKILSGRRRYYNNECIHKIKLIKYLLKEKGMTIRGVKTLLKSESSINLDNLVKKNVSTQSIEKDRIKKKIDKINNIIKELKKFKNG